MNPHSKQQQRAEQAIAELEKVMAEASKAIAQTQQFFEGEGAELKRQLDSLSPEIKARIDAEVALMMEDLEREADRAFRHKMFEQAASYRPRDTRRLV